MLSKFKSSRKGQKLVISGSEETPSPKRWYQKLQKLSLDPEPPVHPSANPTTPLLDRPVEILIPILQALAHAKQYKSLAAVARTSRTLHELAIPLIYVDLHIDSPRAYLRILSALRLPPPPRAAGATGKTTLLQNFASTQRVTLGDLPDMGYGYQLHDALDSIQDPITLCPNAKLLHIHPLQPYTFEPHLIHPTFVQDNESEREFAQFEDNLHRSHPFLGQLCQPTQVCFDEVFGPYAELRSHLSSVSHSFFEPLFLHLEAEPWRQAPELSWHGSLVPRYGPGFPHHSGEIIIGQPFDLIRVYLPSTLDILDPPYDGVTTSLPELWSRSMLAGLGRLGFQASDGAAPSYILNIDNDAMSTGLRLRPTIPPFYDSLESTSSSILSAMNCARAVLGSAPGGRALLDKLTSYSTDLEDEDEEEMTHESCQEDCRPLLAETQGRVDDTVAKSAAMTENEVIQFIIQAQLYGADKRALSVVEMVDSEGSKSYKGLAVKLGMEQVACPMCAYIPY